MDAPFSAEAASSYALQIGNLSERVNILGRRREQFIPVLEKCALQDEEEKACRITLRMAAHHFLGERETLFIDWRVSFRERLVGLVF